MRDLIANLGCCYTEISPSKKGLHIWGLVDWPDYMPNKSRIMLDGKTSVEFYGYKDVRYMTMTGNEIYRCARHRHRAPCSEWFSDDICRTKVHNNRLKRLQSYFFSNIETTIDIKPQIRCFNPTDRVMATREYLANKDKGKCSTSSAAENVSSSSKQSNSANKSDQDIAQISEEFSDSVIAIAKKHECHKKYQYLRQLREIKLCENELAEETKFKSLSEIDWEFCGLVCQFLKPDSLYNEEVLSQHLLLRESRPELARKDYVENTVRKILQQCRDTGKLGLDLKQSLKPRFI